MSLIRIGSDVTRRRVAAQGAQADPPHVEAVVAARRQSPRQFETATEEAFQPLVQYFPAETITLFLAAISVRSSLDHVPAVANSSTLWLVLAFTVLTPLMVLFVAYATFAEKRRSGAIPVDQAFKLPVFELVASAIAFVPWALAVPGIIEGAIRSQVLGPTVEVFQAISAFLGFATSWFLSNLRKILGA